MKLRQKIFNQTKKASTIWGYVACISALLYAAPHLWWGMGISVAFPGEYKSSSDSFWSVAIGFWAMGFVAILAALFALSFIKSWGQRFPRFILLTLGWIGSIGLAFWGLGFFYLRFFMGIGRVVSPPQFVYQDLNIHLIIWGYIWYSLFLVWGISLGLTVLHYQKGCLVQNEKANKSMFIDR